MVQDEVKCTASQMKIRLKPTCFLALLELIPLYLTSNVSFMGCLCLIRTVSGSVLNASLLFIIDPSPPVGASGAVKLSHLCCCCCG